MQWAAWLALAAAVAFVCAHVYCGTRSVHVRDRATGALICEQVPFAVRLQLYLLFGVALGRWVARQPFLRNYQLALSAKKAREMDAPESAARIPAYIAAYGIDTAPVAAPLASFTTLNAFFHRHLKPDARPLAAPGDDAVVVAPADCRLLAFAQSVGFALLWVKGRNFTVETLLGIRPAAAAAAGAGNAHAIAEVTRLGGDRAGQAFATAVGAASSAWQNPALVSCRLAPTDYHRFHAPVAGTIVAHWTLGGDLYSVKPIAVRSDVDVLTDNRRTVVLLASPHAGLVAYVAVGATEVGSIRLSVAVGATVARGDEIGWFAYGGSQLVVLFLESGAANRRRIAFDRDLLSEAKHTDARHPVVETLVQVRSSLGRIVAAAD